MPSYVLTIHTTEAVTPVHLARRVAEACVYYGALRPGEAVEEPQTNARFDVTDVADDLDKRHDAVRAMFGATP